MKKNKLHFIALEYIENGDIELFFSNNPSNVKHKLCQKGFDLCYKNTSVLTTLHFKPKTTDGMLKTFSVTLYPNSVFMIPLSTNRLYTHEIRPSVLDGSMIPTRMGYVVRFSKTNAIYDVYLGTYIYKNVDEWLFLRKGTEEEIEHLRDLYLKENKTTDVIDYNEPVWFSMNSGDYKKPIM